MTNAQSSSNETNCLPENTPLPVCVADYLNTLEQWAHIKAERAQQEQNLIEWMLAHNMTTIALDDGGRLRLAEENVYNPLNKDQMVTGLQNFFRAALPTLQVELDRRIEEISNVITSYLWTQRSRRRVAKIRRLPNAHSLQE